MCIARVCYWSQNWVILRYSIEHDSDNQESKNRNQCTYTRIYLRLHTENITHWKIVQYLFVHTQFTDAASYVISRNHEYTNYRFCIIRHIQKTWVHKYQILYPTSYPEIVSTQISDFVSYVISRNHEFEHVYQCIGIGIYQWPITGHYSNQYIW